MRQGPEALVAPLNSLGDSAVLGLVASLLGLEALLSFGEGLAEVSMAALRQVTEGLPRFGVAWVRMARAL